MTNSTKNSFNARSVLETNAGLVAYYRLSALDEAGIGDISKLPYSIKVLLEAALRQVDGFTITKEDVKNLAMWKDPGKQEIPYKPARVVLQDFTGIPVVVDLAALRAQMARMGGDPERINPQVPVDLVIDHSVQVDRYGSSLALQFNAEREFERNRERYEFVRWGKDAFDNFRVVPPATGIVHQVNLEYLAQVVQTREIDGELVAFPDSLVGTDSHTTMINGLGVAGWGVGGIEAEAVMLGQPIYMVIPEVVGFKMTGALPQGATATDLVLTVTEMLRSHGVVGKFVEYFGSGLAQLSLADRATLANMAPEYGATMGFFPVDEENLRFLRGTGRSEKLVSLVEQYTKAQGLFRTDDSPEPVYTETLELDLGSVVPSMAGPKRPQDRVELKDAQKSMREVIKNFAPERANGRIAVEVDGKEAYLEDGSVVIAAITSCTNTSNPSVMIGAGLLAKKAVEKGLEMPNHVKTSLAPGSKVVTRYLDKAGLTGSLDALGFHTVGYGCTTCIGNSGPLPEAISEAIVEHELVVSAVLSGNRNFEGRVSPHTRGNYLASPPLVVAYALAGTMDIDFQSDPVGTNKDGKVVYLKDIWPTQEEVAAAVTASLSPALFEEEYGNVFDSNETWNKIAVPEGNLYTWNPESTYIQEPPFFDDDYTLEEPDIKPIEGAKVMALLGDSITTDHISPAGAISHEIPAGKFLIERGIKIRDFNSFGSRRGNHEVLMRGAFSNIRLRNKLAPGTEGGITIYHPTGEQMFIYDAAMKYKEAGIPLVVIAGKEYGTGSSRDQAAKGTIWLGVKAVLAESYERIHRSNLIGMGVLPLQFKDGESAESLGLTGFETYDIKGLNNDLQPKQEVTVTATDSDGQVKTFTMIIRIDTPVEARYYRNGGILHTVLRDMLKG